MKVRIVRRPTGYISLEGGPLHEWPRVGDVIDLPDGMAESMIAAGNAKAAPKEEPEPEPEAEVETRPAPTAQVETRDVRAWADEQGIDVPKSGRLPKTVTEAYTAAHEGD